MHTLHSTYFSNILRMGLPSFALGLIGGALASACVLGCWFLWAPESQENIINPTFLRQETELLVDGCQVFCSFHPGQAREQAQVVIRGSNLSADGKTFSATVAMMTVGIADSMSRIGPRPTTTVLAFGSLKLPAQESQSISIPISATIPVGANISVQVGSRAVVLRFPQSATNAALRFDMFSQIPDGLSQVAPASQVVLHSRAQ